MATATATSPGVPPPRYIVPLDADKYGLDDEESAFFKKEMGITDDEQLKQHIIAVQAEAFSIYPYPCIRRFAFTTLKISRLPAYPNLLKLGKEREGAIFLDIGCCFGNDVHKAIADGYPIQNAIASDLQQGFWDLGHKLFNTTPETFPVPFIPGDIFNPAHLQPAEPFTAASPPPAPAPDLAESTRMDDRDVLSQVPTFLIAGHETTSTGTSWALFALATHPAVQTKLRAELLGHSTENPTMDDLNALPYLDAVVRESLRRYPPVQSTGRIAAEDTVIPLDKAVVGKDGIRRHEIRVSKGDWIGIPIHKLNTSKELWGEDGAEFKPERWLAELPEAVHSIPSIYSNLFSFISGAHACIGYRFAVTEYIQFPLWTSKLDS
ncbi:hypothetical protein EWM64_g7955 [Hericium alpestre]|uniref:Cytochrome P450 n=1 Tax=Hericium alpestre TaxID=135208 RepID=A0A4Y9ZMF8_9AGAM|nr:hypothetical protein EWM64_g7955 [Hericium alpestre]